MDDKKKTFFIILLINLLAINLSSSEVNIILKINNTIITNYDIEREGSYLKILNPQLRNLSDNQVFELAKKSLIKEIIKKNELSRFFDLSEENDFANDYLNKILINLGYKDPIEFKNDLIKNNTYNFEEVQLKSKIEIFWNELIYDRFKDQININKEKISKKIEDFPTKAKELLLSEIIFRKGKEENLDELIKKIMQSIDEIGFNNTANIYSISSSSKFGGKIGWFKEETLSRQIFEEVNRLKINEITNVIKIDNNFIILKLEDIKFNLIENDFNKELQKQINIETNKQLENYSKIYFNRIFTNYNIDEK